MSVINVDKDFDALTITLTAEFDAPVERVWQLWEDPRQLERWWGPPSHPATMEQFDLTPGGRVNYFMTGPDGEKYHGWWQVESVDAPRSLEFIDGFADDEGKPIEDRPVSKARVELSDLDGRTRMVLRSVSASREQMEELVAMGAAEGLEQAVGQMDALLRG
jgi:uncharacterized protein YndB with AHSA1/START domain